MSAGIFIILLVTAIFVGYSIDEKFNKLEDRLDDLEDKLADRDGENILTENEDEFDLLGTYNRVQELLEEKKKQDNKET